MFWILIAFSLLVIPKPEARDYPDASAVYILDSTNVYVDDDLSRKTHHHVIMRILNKRGRDRHSNFMQRYDGDSEEIEILLDETHTIKETGEVVEVSEEEGIGDLATISATVAPAYSNARIKVCAFGGVEVGDFLEYASNKTTLQMEEKPSALFGSVTFSSDEPILHKVFVLDLPQGLNIKYKIRGDIIADSNFFNGRETYRFSSDSIARIEHEEWMLPVGTSGQSVIYTTFSSWDDVGDWLRECFERSIEPNGEVAKEAKRLGNLKEICESVALGWRDIPVGFDDVGFAPTSTEKIYKNRYASGLDKVALLVAMLRAIGEDAYPAYVARNGVDEDMPSPTYFDNVIVAIEKDGAYIVIDPVFPSGSFHKTGLGGILIGKDNIYPPPFNRGYGTCFIVRQDSAFFHMIDDTPSKSEVFAELELSREGHLRGKINGILRGVDAAFARSNLRGKLPKKLKQAFEGYASMIKPGTKAISWSVNNLDSIFSPVDIELEFDSPDYLIRLPDEYRLNLPSNIFGFFPLVSYFGCESREFPFTVLSPHITELAVKITLPAGFELKYMPGSMSKDNDLIIASFDFESGEECLSYRTVWGFKKGIYEAWDYMIIEDVYSEYVSPARSFFLLEE